MHTFEADLRRFWAMTEERLERIIRAAVTEMLERMQTKALGVSAGGVLRYGFIPYVTTALVTSLTFIVGGSRAVGQYVFRLAMRNYSLGEGIQFFWDVPYFRYIEQGGPNFAGWHFMEANAAHWPDLVLKHARRIRRRRT